MASTIAGAEPHHVLASWLPVYLTTNYDDFMVRRWKRTIGKRTRLCRWNKGLRIIGIWQRGQRQPTANAPIYHMHGCSELAKSRCAEDDYLEFIYNIAGAAVTKTVDCPWEMLPPWIMRAISNHCLMFLG